jgi:uncharacterized membrane protein
MRQFYTIRRNLCIYCLCTDAVSSSDYVVLNDRVINE